MTKDEIYDFISSFYSLDENEIIKAALGEHIYENFKEAKEVEFDMYRTTVHQWERDMYMKMY